MSYLVKPSFASLREHFLSVFVLSERLVEDGTPPLEFI